MDFTIERLEDLVRGIKIMQVPLVAAFMPRIVNEGNIKSALLEVSGAMAVQAAVTESLYPIKQPIQEELKMLSGNKFAGVATDLAIGFLESYVIISLVKQFSNTVI